MTDTEKTNEAPKWPSDSKAMLGCQHKEWIGQPAGCVPLSWRCCDCGTTMTAGEMIIYGKLLQQQQGEIA